VAYFALPPSGDRRLANMLPSYALTIIIAYPYTVVLAAPSLRLAEQQLLAFGLSAISVDSMAAARRAVNVACTAG